MEFKALKFEKINEPYKVELSFDSPRVTPSNKFPGKNMIWYGIKPLISGENGFNASESLKTMIDLSGAKAGDTIEIKKMQGDKFAFFMVNGKSMEDFKSGLEGQQVVEESVQQVADSFSTTTPENVEYKEKRKDIPMEQKVEIMWKKYAAENSIDDLPF